MGRLTDGQGRTVDFRNAVLIMTSNVGSDAIQQHAGRDEERVREMAMEALQAKFRPEFLNRIDDVVIFEGLSKDSILHILEIQLRHLGRLLAGRDLALDITDSAKHQLAEQGFDPVYGARPLKRTVQKELQNRLAQEILGGVFVPGDTIRVDALGDELVFSRAEAAPSEERQTVH